MVFVPEGLSRVCRKLTGDRNSKSADVWDTGRVVSQRISRSFNWLTSGTLIKWIQELPTFIVKQLPPPKATSKGREMLLPGQQFAGQGIT